MKFSIKDFFSKCEQIRSFLCSVIRIFSCWRITKFDSMYIKSTKLIKVNYHQDNQHFKLKLISILQRAINIL